MYNNTVFNCHIAGIQLGETALATDVVNNLLFDNAIGVSGPGTGTALSNNLTADPLFVDAAARDFRLLPGSPAIDAGVALPEVERDFAGIARPLGGGYDVGAFESG